MQPLASAMTSLRKAIVHAIRSLLRGKSLLQAILSFWISPAALKTANVEPATTVALSGKRTIQDFLAEAEDLLIAPVEGDALNKFVSQLKTQFRAALLSNPACMLPSFNHQLPSGHENGQYLALDVGGSTLRVALVELRGRDARGDESRIVRINSFKIDLSIKALEGMAFFDWMASRIHDTVAQELNKDNCSEKPLLMGLAWSFPLEQVSIKGGLLQGMGKGFLAANGLLGQDLGDLIKLACKRTGLHIELSAIVNDSAAALLAQAYIDTSTRLSLILGTGVNVAAHLPVSAIGRAKYGQRSQSWFDVASHVIVNTELGMFGKDILPMTRWDEQLNSTHPKPEFQPLEHLVSGFYLGEMCRLALVEAIQNTDLFGGVVPPSLEGLYSLETETLSIIEADTDPSHVTAINTFASRHPSTVRPTAADIAALRTLSSFITRRSSAVVAASVFGLWSLKADMEAEYRASLDPTSTSFIAETDAEMSMQRTLVAFNGSVIENYPHYLTNCQKYIDGLAAAEGKAPGTIDLVAAKESSLLGAAVSLACIDE